MKIKATPLTAAIAGVFSAVTMPLLWPRLQADSLWLMLAFVLLVAFPAHAFVVGFERSRTAAGTLDTALLKRVGAWLGASAVALLATWAPTAAAEPVVHQATGISFPDEVAGYQRGKVEDFEGRQPGLGVSYEYLAGRGVYANVYVFTGGVASVPGDVDHPLFAQLRDQTRREIAQFAQGRGEIVRPGIDAVLKVQAPSGEVKVMFDAFIISAPSGARNSFLWLWPARGHFVKIRLTRAPGGELDTKQMRDFYESLVRLTTD